MAAALVPGIGISPGPAWLVPAAFACIYFIWGSTFLAIRIALEGMPPLLAAGTRFVLAGALMYGWSGRRAGTRPPTAGEWSDAILSGALLFFITNGVVFWAEQRIASGSTALFVATIPVWITVLESLRSRAYRPAPRVIVGLVAGLGGVTLLMDPNAAGAPGAVDPLTGAALILATLAWAAGTVFSRSARRPADLIQLAAMQLLAGGTLLLIAGTVLGEWSSARWEGLGLRETLAWCYLVGPGSIVSFSAYTFLLRVRPASQVATYAFVNPVVAILVGWALGGEPISVRTLAAMAAVVVGVTMVLRR